jgi:hypothetical protein
LTSPARRPSVGAIVGNEWRHPAENASLSGREPSCDAKSRATWAKHCVVHVVVFSEDGGECLWGGAGSRSGPFDASSGRTDVSSRRGASGLLTSLTLVLLDYSDQSSKPTLLDPSHELRDNRCLHATRARGSADGPIGSASAEGCPGRPKYHSPRGT